MTAYKELSDVVKSKAAGFSYHFTKPLEVGAFLAVVEKIVDAKRGKGTPIA